MMSEARKQPTDAGAGNIGSGGPDDAAEFGRILGLGIEGFQLAGAATEPEPDDRLARLRLPVCGSACSATQQIGQHHAGQAEGADLEEITACAAVASAGNPRS